MLGFFDGRDAGDEVHLHGLPDFGALEYLPDDVEEEEEGDVDVWCHHQVSYRRTAEKIGRRGKRRTASQEIRRVEVPEDGDAVDEDEDADPEDTPYGEVRLELAVVDEFGAVEALGFHASVCERSG